MPLFRVNMVCIRILVLSEAITIITIWDVPSKNVFGACTYSEGPDQTAQGLCYPLPESLDTIGRINALVRPCIYAGCESTHFVLAQRHYFAPRGPYGTLDQQVTSSTNNFRQYFRFLFYRIHGNTLNWTGMSQNNQYFLHGTVSFRRAKVVCKEQKPY